MQVSVELSLDERSPCELRKVDLLQKVTIWCGARCAADPVYTLSPTVPSKLPPLPGKA